MSNMSYCRFENTVRDLRDCYHNLHDDLTGSEVRYRVQLINLCKDILESAGIEVDRDAVPVFDSDEN